jgi:hypothetical protein
MEAHETERLDEEWIEKMLIVNESIHFEKGFFFYL